MPGISISSSKDALIRLQAEKLIELEDDFKIHNFLVTDTCNITISGNANYPFEIIVKNNGAIFIEGIVFSSTKKQKNKENALSGLLDNIECNNLSDLINEFNEQYDGTYRICLTRKDINRIIYFGDKWSRLSCFYIKTPMLTAISREMKFLLPFSKILTIDKVGIMEILTLKYNLGPQSIFSEINRLQYNEYIDINDNLLAVKQLHNHSLDGEPKERMSFKDCVDFSIRELLLYMKNISFSLETKKMSAFFDISAGFDSRLLVGIGKKIFDNIDGCVHKVRVGDEIAIASNLAKKLNINLKILEHPPFNSNIDEIKKIVIKTDAKVNIYTAYPGYTSSLLLQKIYPSKSVRFSGFGGEYFRRPRQKQQGEKTITDVMLSDSKISLFTICNLFNKDICSFKDHLQKYAKSLPEKTLQGQIRHIYFDYYNKLVGAGEDIARSHFWTEQPLLSKKVFENIFIHNSHVSSYRFFISLLNSINPILCTIPTDHYPKTNMLNRLHVLLLDIRAFLNYFKGPLRNSKCLRLIQAQLKLDKKNKSISSIEDSFVKDQIATLYKRSPSLSTLISSKSLDIFLKSKDTVIKYHLLTLFLYIDWIELDLKKEVRISNISSVM